MNEESLTLYEDFPYLRKKIVYNNSNWQAVYQNLRKLRSWWGMIMRVLEKTGTTVWSRGMMYNAVAQSVILYCSKIWVVMGEMLMVLEGFHHQATRRIKAIDSNMWGGLRVLIPPCSGGTGSCRTTTHKGVH